MPSTKKTKKTDLRADQIRKMLEVCEREIIQSSVMAEFYDEEYGKTKDKEQAAKTRLKADQIRQNIAFNERFREFIKSKA